MKIGIFGGTFNPLHCGHLISAERIREEHSLDRILFIPSKRPVHKSLDGGVPPDERFEMIKRGIAGNRGFGTLRIELDREDPSYTIITVKELLEKNRDWDLYLILGSDAFREIATWKDYRELVELVSLIVMARPGCEAGGEVPDNARNVIFAGNPLVEISSSDIRERVRQGKSIRYLVPEGIERYIREKELYRA